MSKRDSTVPEKRTLTTQTARKCPACGGDCFVTATRAYPPPMAARMRYYKCGKCGQTHKD